VSGVAEEAVADLDCHELADSPESVLGVRADGGGRRKPPAAFSAELSEVPVLSISHELPVSVALDSGTTVPAGKGWSSDSPPRTTRGYVLWSKAPLARRAAFL
jgi:hypothetical protein